jgi:phage-related protein
MISRGISFGDVHSYHDLNLLLSEVDIPPAQPKTTYVDIPGGDGSIDLTEAHGEVKYKDRNCSFTFTMNPADDLSDSAFEEKKTEISNLLNGQVFKITLDKDEDYYFEGRCEVSEYLSDKRLHQIVVKATVKPYKYKQNVTTMKFELSEPGRTINIMNGRKAVSPSITCSDDDTVIVFNGATYNLSAGTHKVLDIRLTKGNNQMTISGAGMVTFSFQEADL